MQTQEIEETPSYAFVHFFDGTQYSEEKEIKGATCEFKLSDLAYNHHMQQFLGWKIGNKQVLNDLEEIITVTLNEDISIEPLFDINFTQESPQKLDYFASRLNMAKYDEFSSLSTQGFIYPALSEKENVVIQGATFVEKYNLVLLSAYIPTRNSYGITNSLIFVIDLNLTDSNGFKGRLTKTILLHDTNGNVFNGHVGGITATEQDIYVTDNNSLLRLPLDTVLIPNKLIFAKFEEEIHVPVKASFCFFDNNILWVGEFVCEKEGFYPIPKHISTHNGIEYTAWTVGYVIDESNGKSHVFEMVISDKNSTAIPDHLIIHGDKIQGFAIYDSYVVLSESFGRKNDSHWFIYDFKDFDNTKENPDITSVSVGGVEIKAVYLNNPRTLTAPPMSEDLCLIKEKNKKYLLFISEGACSKYLDNPIMGGSVNPSSLTWKIDLDLLK